MPHRVDRLIANVAPAAAVLGMGMLLGHQVRALSRAELRLLVYLPAAVVVAGMLLTLGFKRSRGFFLLLLLGLVHGAVAVVLPQAAERRLDPSIMYVALCVLVPINVLALGLLEERGVWTGRGAVRLVVLLLQVPLVLRLGHLGGAWATGAGGLWWLAPWTLSATPVPPAALGLMLVAAAALSARAVRCGAALDTGQLGVLASLGLVLHYRDDGAAALLQLSGAGVIVMVAVLQDSYRMAFLDELTALPGRRALQLQLLKLGSRYAVGMLDVDHFKQFNDRYGHDVGDQVLRLVAATMRRVGGGGKPFRYGGEEFTVVFPGKTAADAMAHLEALRQAVEQAGFVVRSSTRLRRPPPHGQRRGGGKRVSVTISIGVAEGERAAVPAEALKAADKALYRAKSKGRNQVCR